MDSNTRPVNINISNSGEDSKITTENVFKDYIIVTNQKLDEENKELRKKISDIETDNSEKEDENDKLETRVRYMRGLLQNFNEIKKHSLQITDLKNELCQKYKNLSKRCKKNDVNLSNFFVYYFWSLWSLILFDFVIINLWYGSGKYQYLKIFMYHLIPFIFWSLIYSFILKDEKFYFGSLYHLKKGIPYLNISNEYDNLVQFESETEIKITQKLSELKKIEEGSVGVSEMIDNI